MNSKYDSEGNGLKGQMATSPTILVLYRAHIVMDIHKNSAYTMYRHKKIAQSLKVHLGSCCWYAVVSLHTTTKDVIGMWAPSSDKRVWEQPTHPVAIRQHSCPSSLCTLHYSTHRTRQQSLNHHSSSPSSLCSIYCFLQAKTMTCDM